MIKKIIPLCLILIVISGCADKYFPIPSNDVVLSEEFGIIETDDFVLAVNNKYWDKRPQELTDYFTTFYISFKNKTKEKIEFNYNDFYLIDSEGNQYDVVNLEEVMTLLIPDDLFFQQITTLKSEQDDSFENWKEARSNLMKYSFNFGLILPNVRKAGFVFFQKLPSNNLSCRIIYKDTEIGFIKEK